MAAPQVPDPYYPLDGNVGYDVRHYDIHDRYRFGDKRLSGVTKIRLVPSVELTTFNLDLLLRVDRVRVAGAAAEFEKLERPRARDHPGHAARGRRAGRYARALPRLPRSHRVAG